VDFVEPDIDKVTALIFTSIFESKKCKILIKVRVYNLFSHWMHKYRHENDTQEYSTNAARQITLNKTNQSFDLAKQK
jgi:hypothetical protein